MRDDDDASTSLPVGDLIIYAAMGALFGGVFAFMFASSRGSHSAELWAGVGAIAGCAMSCADVVRRLRRRRKAMALAEREGVKFLPVDTGLQATLRDDFPDLDVSISNVMRKDVGGLSLALVELAITTTTEHGDKERSTTRRQTAVYYHSLRERYPRYDLQPATFATKMMAAAGMKGLAFNEAPEFASQYFVLATDAAQARALFDTDIIAWFSAHPGLHVRSGVAGVLVYEDAKLLEPETVEDFMNDAAQLVRLLDDPQRLARAHAAAKDDLRVFAAQLPAFEAKRILERIITREQAEAFVRQSAPREIPANIAAWCDSSAPKLVIGIGILFAAVGSVFAMGFHSSGDWRGVLFGLAFATLGASLLLFFGTKRWRLTRLLRNGDIAVAKIESVQSTGWTMNGNAVFNVALHFNAFGAVCQVRRRVTDPAARRVKLLADQGKPTAVLYDPTDAHRVVVIEELVTEGAA